jgi:hypothetical protein
MNYFLSVKMYEKVDTFGIFSQKFVNLDDEGQDRLVKATLRLFEAQKGIKSDAASTGTQGCQSPILEEIGEK